jgi:hypothetical protein
MNPDYELTQGDVPGPLLATLYDATGAVVDLTTASAVVFHMEQLDGTHVAPVGTASIVNAPGGQVSYAWAIGDSAVSEYRLFEFRVTFANGRVIAFPTDPKLLLRVVPAVA